MQTPKPTKSNSAKQDSFKKKLFRLRRDTTHCDICNEQREGALEAAHIIDHAFQSTLEAEFCKDESHDLPLSINDSENGLLLCSTCHTYYDKKKPWIRITGDGTIRLYHTAKKNNYGQLDGKIVHWAHQINKRFYPTSAVLNYSMKLKPADDSKRLRELNEESEDNDEERPMPTKKRASPPTTPLVEERPRQTKLKKVQAKPKTTKKSPTKGSAVK